MDGQGDIFVYTGDCTKGANGSSLWQFKPALGNLIGNGTWEELQISGSSESGVAVLQGANYLASAIAFSSITNATADMYVFAGMCPNTTTSTASDWTQNAEYSNSLLAFGPSQSSLSPIPSYNFTLSSSKNAPIAEAGFTITPLAPAFSESSDNQTQSVNQNYVLIGGHTQQAFLNMSQVALFSLPEQSWSFVSVDAPSSAPPTDLTVRGVNSIDSRSGHTATLTPDGKNILVFGGWVGDVTTPANPQLVVLELGQGYGGNGDWQWAIPTATGDGLPPGAGIYGHGAAMIAGDVLVVTGGFQIPASGSSNRRSDSPTSNSANYLFNTTSSSFISSYTHPTIDAGQANHDADSDASRTKERVGLGVGLTIGIIALIIVVVIYFWYSRRLKRRRDVRNEELRKLAAGAQRFHLSGRDGAQTAHEPEMAQRNFADTDRAYQPHPWVPGNSTASTIHSDDRTAPEAARTGLLFEIPSPTRGLRRSLHSRGSYQPAPRYDDGRRGLTSTIHPIDERDEDNEGVADQGHAADNDMIHRSDFQLLDNVPVLDPFRDTAGSRTPSPQSPEQREAEVRGWMNDWTEAEAMMSTWNRGSPEKTDRTSSTLSDMSAKSMQSYSSLQRSMGGPSRSVSQKSAGVFSAIPLHSTNNTTPQNGLLGRSDSTQRQPGHDRSRSLTSPAGIHHAHTHSDSTDKSFIQPHYENDTLLGNQAMPESTSPSKMGRRAKGWMGSMRRVFTGGVDHPSSATPDQTKTAQSSPTKDGFNDVNMPQRAASTGGMILQRRQGARDWENDGSSARPVNDAGMIRRDEGDEDWDVESAVERRVVQVMFTVPKEKLRVVNKNPDGDGESILSSMYEDAVEGDAGSISGKGKERE